MTHDELLAAGLPVSADAHQRLARYVNALLDERTRLNLTAARTPEQIWTAHICDSLALLAPLAEYGARRLVDVGSGGGLPGIPLACALLELQVTLIDATRKKVDALRRIATAVGLNNVTCGWGRAEELAHDPAWRESFDALAARAVSDLPRLVEYTAGLVRAGGRCWYYKSLAGERDELPAARGAAEACGLRFVRRIAYTLPGDLGARVLLEFEKTRPTPAHLPRATGEIARRPLR